ncbi:hypothetical protein [Anaerovibrio slackiae]
MSGYEEEMPVDMGWQAGVDFWLLRGNLAVGGVTAAHGCFACNGGC